MQTFQDIQNTLRLHKPDLESRYPISELAVFGSYARGDATPGSDVDILVSFHSPIGLAFATLADELESLLHKKVDLVSKKAIQPHYWEYVKKDLIHV